MQGRSFRHARWLVSKVLLEFARDATNERNRLAQRDIAKIIGADWETVHMSLKSLQDEGIIRIERNRITINKELLKEIVGCNTK
jgi:DNA-binding MarR family transcriptional regulator